MGRGRLGRLRGDLGVKPKPASRVLGVGAALVPVLLLLAVVAPGAGAVIFPQPAAAPVVSGVSPSSGPAAGGTLVTVSGSGFTGAAAVDFGGTAAASFWVVSDSQLAAVSPAGSPGTVDVTVTTPDGTSAAGPADQFTFVAAPIRHIVVLMQENHTFDSELGYWCDQNPGRCTGLPATVTLADKTVVTPGVTPDTVPDVAHSVKEQNLALRGNWDQIPGCSASTGYACISGYPPAVVPNLAALAGRYTLLDHAFTLANSPSWGGHLDEFLGNTDGFTGDNPVHDKTQPPGSKDWGCDSYDLAAYGLGATVTHYPSCVPDYNLDPSLYPHGGAFEATPVQQETSVLQEMDAAGVSWKIYSGRPSSNGSAWAGWSGCPSLASCLDTPELSNLTGSPQQFFTDAAAGTLPDVSFIMPSGAAKLGGKTFYYAADSQHNLQSNAAGDNFVGQVASALAASPDWSSSALIITYDDCGCFYDQVPPPLAPDGRHMGFRVPFIIVSPYALQAHTDTTPTSSTGSILAFIEADFGLPALGRNDAAADNLMGDFNLGQQPAAMPRMTSQPLPASAYRLSPGTAKDPT